MRIVFAGIALVFAALAAYVYDCNGPRSFRFTDPLDYRDVSAHNARYNASKQHRWPLRYDAVIIAVLDGVRRDYLYNAEIAPNITARWRAGGMRFENAQCMLPSVSAPNYYAIMTGAPPFLNGITNNARRFQRHARIPTVFHRLKQHGRAGEVIGFVWYGDLAAGQAQYIQVERGREDTPGVTAALLSAVQSNSLSPLTLVHYTAPDTRAHQTRSNASPEYLHAVTSIDSDLGRVFRELDARARNACVIVMADHGMDSDGHHGGSDALSLDIPLYILARDIPHGVVRRQVHNISIAPTVAAMLGAPLPDCAAGTIIHEVVGADRRVSYLTESIEKKGHLIGMLRGSAATAGFAVGGDIVTSLESRDLDQTKDILGFVEERNAESLFYQRVGAIACAIALIAWVVFKSGHGVPTLVALNALYCAGIAVGKYMVTSNARFTEAIAAYLVALVLGALLFRAIFMDRALADQLALRALGAHIVALLLCSSIVAAIAVIPLHPLVPDQHLYAFRFSMALFAHPVLFAGLMFLLAAQRRREAPDAG
ncbi:MAG TPA: alkaline phosphatase family protein [Spirochaetota bacterium]|nr:alkaline phosphatase family protein [Spirochaetota bacterium]HNT12936.1 alkaline phosphatase family protein [Spirochaetota bacterium]